MKKYSFRSISHIINHVPSTKKPVYNSYDNKELLKWDSDNFADYVFDHLNAHGKPAWNEEHWLYQIEMLDYIPQDYARVYLYGVWVVVEEILRINTNLKKAS